MLAAVAPSAIRAQCWYESLYVCERAMGLRNILNERVDCCVFSDIMDRLKDVPKNATARELGFDRLRALIMGASVACVGKCARHGGWCQYRSHVALDVSGSPCRPWSRACRQERRGRQHKDIRLFLAWCAIMRSVRPYIAIHENVIGFDMALLLSLLGDLYDIVKLRVAPARNGFAFIRRPRNYFILTLRGVTKAGNLQAIYDRVSSHFADYDVSGWPSWVWRASRSELLEEENRARRTARSEPLAAPSSDWAYLLSQKQRDTLKAAEVAWADKYGSSAQTDPLCVFDLSQSIERLSISRGMLPTLRTQSERLWSPMQKRWMTFAERLACMGYPVYSDLAAAARVPIDTISPKGPRFSVGNAMHVANLGIIVLVVLSGCDFPG